jgi:hypothetical protein
MGCNCGGAKAAGARATNLRFRITLPEGKTFSDGTRIKDFTTNVEAQTAAARAGAPEVKPQQVRV